MSIISFQILSVKLLEVFRKTLLIDKVSLRDISLLIEYLTRIFPAIYIKVFRE